MMDAHARELAQKLITLTQARLGAMVRLQRTPAGVPGTQTRAKWEAADREHARAILAHTQAEQALQAEIHASYGIDLEAQLKARLEEAGA